MIIGEKKNCCGCSACAIRCPKQCITMQEDEQGFLYPVTDFDSCINCGICEEVCPYLNQAQHKKPLVAETAVNPDSKVRINSSSGGVFTVLADYIISKGGVVFGARFNNHWEVVIDYTESLDGLALFRGSKYLQSIVGDSFFKVESFLKKGREVLFSGTPCQIAGLHLYLQKDYKNLLTVAIACHSVPSPLVWREYLKGFKPNPITDIRFRDKRVSWEDYGISICQENRRDFFQRHSCNSYMQLFLHGITTRPSCFNCPAKDGKSRADMIIGDCWGISQMLPNFPNDHLGVSFVLCYSERGLTVLRDSGMKGSSLQYDQIVLNNGGLTTKNRMQTERSFFWSSFLTEDNKSEIINQFAQSYLPGLNNKIRRFFNRLKNK